MTDTTKPADDGPENALSPEAIREREHIARAQAEERSELLEAANGHLQERVIRLNVQVRLRDDRIAELERELAAYRLSEQIDQGAGPVDDEDPEDPHPEP